MTETAHKPEADDDPAPAPALCACGHPGAVHDPIATRFCDATLAGALPRSCICRE